MDIAFRYLSVLLFLIFVFLIAVLNPVWILYLGAGIILRLVLKGKYRGKVILFAILAVLLLLLSRSGLFLYYPATQKAARWKVEYQALIDVIVDRSGVYRVREEARLTAEQEGQIAKFLITEWNGVTSVSQIMKDNNWIYVGKENESELYLRDIPYRLESDWVYPIIKNLEINLGSVAVGEISQTASQDRLSKLVIRAVDDFNVYVYAPANRLFSLYPPAALNVSDQKGMVEVKLAVHHGFEKVANVRISLLNKPYTFLIWIRRHIPSSVWEFLGWPILALGGIFGDWIKTQFLAPIALRIQRLLSKKKNNYDVDVEY